MVAHRAMPRRRNYESSAGCAIAQAPAQVPCSMHRAGPYRHHARATGGATMNGSPARDAALPSSQELDRSGTLHPWIWPPRLPPRRHVIANSLAEELPRGRRLRRVGAATLALHLSQSRVSAHIAALEHALGVTLSIARPTDLPDPGGRAVRGHAVTALLELQRGVKRPAARWQPRRARDHRQLSSVSSTYLPAVLRELQVKHPGRDGRAVRRDRCDPGGDGRRGSRRPCVPAAAAEDARDHAVPSDDLA